MAAWIFTINPGSTSTKTALFRDTACQFESVVRHDADQLHQLPSLADQLPLRLAAIESALEAGLAQAGLPGLEAIDAYVGRGGMLRPLASGTYAINPAMLEDLEQNRYGVHASNLGAPIAAGLSARYGKPAFIVDPVSVDELIQVARYTGLPDIQRRSVFHALNQKAMARHAASELGKSYAELNLIVAHLGGGISVGAHRHGRVIDVNNGIEEGPMSPERVGSLPTLQLVDFAANHQYTPEQVRRVLVGRGGLVAYTGTADALAIERGAADNPAWMELLEAMAYQISKTIGSMAASLQGQVDAIVITGGMARSPLLTGFIRPAVSFIAPLIILPGEHELEAMAEGALRVLRGEEKALDYVQEVKP